MDWMATTGAESCYFCPHSLPSAVGALHMQVMGCIPPLHLGLYAASGWRMPTRTATTHFTETMHCDNVHMHILMEHNLVIALQRRMPRFAHPSITYTP